VRLAHEMLLFPSEELSTFQRQVHSGCAIKIGASAAEKSIRCTRPRSKCVGKGKAHRPYEFGVKVSVATTLARSKGGQFIAHVKTLPGNPPASPALSPTAAIAATTRRPAAR